MRKIIAAWLLSSVAFAAVNWTQIDQVITFFATHDNTDVEARTFLKLWNLGKQGEALKHLIIACGKNDQCKGQINVAFGENRSKLADIVSKKLSEIKEPPLENQTLALTVTQGIALPQPKDPINWGEIHKIIWWDIHKSKNLGKVTHYMELWNKGQQDAAVNSIVDTCGNPGCAGQVHAAFGYNRYKFTEVVMQELGPGSSRSGGKDWCVVVLKWFTGAPGTSGYPYIWGRRTVHSSSKPDGVAMETTRKSGGSTYTIYPGACH